MSSGDLDTNGGQIFILDNAPHGRLMELLYRYGGMKQPEIGTDDDGDRLQRRERQLEAASDDGGRSGAPDPVYESEFAYQ